MSVRKSLTEFSETLSWLDISINAAINSLFCRSACNIWVKCPKKPDFQQFLALIHMIHFKKRQNIIKFWEFNVYFI